MTKPVYSEQKLNRKNRNGQLTGNPEAVAGNGEMFVFFRVIPLSTEKTVSGPEGKVMSCPVALTVLVLVRVLEIPHFYILGKVIIEYDYLPARRD